MPDLFFTLLFIFLIWSSAAYDNFEGLFQQDKPCFEVVNTFDSPNCDPNDTLSQDFSPPYKGVNTNPMNTKFYLFTAENPDKAELLHKCGGMLPCNTDFDPTHDTIVICHGYIDGVCRSSWMREFKLQFMLRGKYNVILVDWTWGNLPDDASAAANSRVAGEDIGFVVKNIMMQQNLDGSRFYFIGHSYGSFAINAGAQFIYDCDPDLIIRRLTYLDPAGGPFPNDDPLELLKPDVATFIDAIHSGGGVCIPFRLGIINAVADADFYPNGGHTNPSCYSYAPTYIAKGDYLFGFISILPQFCYHLQAIQFYKVSINKPDGKPYIGVICDSYEAFQNGSCSRCCTEDAQQCAVAGVEAEFYFPFIGQPRQNRKYYFNTANECPYPGLICQSCKLYASLRFLGGELNLSNICFIWSPQLAQVHYLKLCTPSNPNPSKCNERFQLGGASLLIKACPSARRL